jgi:transposase InsO family protein
MPASALSNHYLHMRNCGEPHGSAQKHRVAQQPTLNTTRDADTVLPHSRCLHANNCRAVDGPNQRWSLDFVSDALTDGRRFRILAVVDDFSRENLVLVADTSLSGQRVARELDQIIAERCMPKTIVSDNGTEFASMAILKWI